MHQITVKQVGKVNTKNPHCDTKNPHSKATYTILLIDQSTDYRMWGERGKAAIIINQLIPHFTKFTPCSFNGNVHAVSGAVFSTASGIKRKNVNIHNSLHKIITLLLLQKFNS